MVSRRLAAAVLAGLFCAAGANAQTPDGPDRVEETYRNWIVRCETPEAQDGTPGARVCEMAQELGQQESGQRVIRMALQANEAGAALSIVTPFGLRLSEGVELALGPEPLAEIPFRTCLPQGCIATAELDEVTLDQLGTGETLDVRLTADAGQTVALSLSLDGFAGAWARLDELRGE